MNKWTCDGCGELHDSQFDSCWHCGAYRVANSQEQENSDFTLQTAVPTPPPNAATTKSEFRSEWYPRILGNMRNKTSVELVDILNNGHTDEWSEETFVAAREVLAERSFPKPVVETATSCSTDTAADTLDVTLGCLPASTTEVSPVEIFIAKREQKTGPFTIQQIETMISSEMIDTTDLAWHLGLSDWLPLHEVLDICPSPPRTTSNADNSSAIYFPLNNMQDSPHILPSPHTIFCVTCGSKLSAGSEQSGLLAVCPNCGGTIQVPIFCDPAVTVRPTTPPPLPMCSLKKNESAAASLEHGFRAKHSRQREDFTDISWWFSFSGFVGRLAFFQATIVRLSVFLLLGIIPGLIVGESGLITLVVIWPLIVWSNVSFMARRMRDVGESPWIAILGVIPFAATAFGIVCFFWPTKQRL